MIIKKSISTNSWFIYTNYDSLELNDYYINIAIEALDLQSNKTYEIKNLDKNLQKLILDFIDLELEKAKNKIDYLNYLQGEIK